MFLEGVAAGVPVGDHLLGRARQRVQQPRGM